MSGRYNCVLSLYICDVDDWFIVNSLVLYMYIHTSLIPMGTSRSLLSSSIEMLWNLHTKHTKHKSLIHQIAHSLSLLSFAKKKKNQKCYRITDGLNIQLCIVKEEEEQEAKNQFTSVLLLLLLTTLLHLLFTINTYDACV